MVYWGVLQHLQHLGAILAAWVVQFFGLDAADKFAVKGPVRSVKRCRGSVMTGD